MREEELGKTINIFISNPWIVYFSKPYFLHAEKLIKQREAIAEFDVVFKCNVVIIKIRLRVWKMTWITMSSCYSQQSYVHFPASSEVIVTGSVICAVLFLEKDRSSTYVVSFILAFVIIAWRVVLDGGFGEFIGVVFEGFHIWCPCNRLQCILIQKLDY